MQGTVITDLHSISAGGGWKSRTPIAFYQAPALERVEPGALGSCAGFRRSSSPGAAGRLVRVEHLAMGRSSPEIRHAAASQAARRSSPPRLLRFRCPGASALPGPRPGRSAGLRTPRPPFALPLLTAAVRLGDIVPTMPRPLFPRGTGGPHAGSARLARSAAAADRPPRRTGRASRWVPRACGKSLARIPQRRSFPGDFAAGMATTFHPLARMLSGI